MSKGGDAPPAPDPRQVAAAQTAQNIGTAIAQQSLNNVNQVTPYGSLNYEQTGTTQWTDPNSGAVYDIPMYTATQTLSPEQQQLLQTGQATQQSLADTGLAQAGLLGEVLGAPVDLTNDAVEGRLMDLGRSRLDPALDRRRESEMTRLAQQGITRGSEAYDRAMSRLDESDNDAYNQLMLQGRGQSVQEILAARNQPINETSALMSGSQVSQPSFINPNTPQLANVDRAGLEMNAYNQQLAAWQQQQQSAGGLFGGILGAAGNIGAAGIGAGIFSDRRLKTDVQKIGEVGPLGLYTFRYVGTPEKHVGFMADEVALIAPEAVSQHETGFAQIDCDMALEAAA